MKKIISIGITCFCFLVSIITTQAQETDFKDKLTRDIIGDLNSESVKKGDFPGAIRIPGSDVSLAIGGYFKATAIFDSKYNVKNEIVLPGTFTDNVINDGQTYVGAKSSRLFFDARATVENYNLEGYLELDFRGANSFTFRHAYMRISNSNGQKLLLGQFWSLLMDLQSLPEGLVEPTVSGAPFSRHGQIRFTQPISKTLEFSVAIEDPNLSDIQGKTIIPSNKYPDFVGALVYNPVAKWHFSVSSLYRPIRVELGDNEFKNKTGYLVNGVAILRPNSNNKITVSGLYGEGVAAYVMGSDNLGGYKATNQPLELQTNYGGFAAFQHKWNTKLRTNIAFGKFMADEMKSLPNASIKSSTYAFVNSFYKLNKYVTLGIEWIYGEKENYGTGTLSNNRFQIGMQIF